MSRNIQSQIFGKLNWMIIKTISYSIFVNSKKASPGFKAIVLLEDAFFENVSSDWIKPPS